MLLALLAALATGPTSPPPPGPAVTRLEVSSDAAPASEQAKDHLPLFTGSDDRLKIEVRLGDHGPFRFLVDTGADRTAVSRQLAERIGLRPGRRARLHSVAGVSEVDTASVRDLRISARRLPDVEAPLLDARHVGADGILGTDVLRASQVRFDFRAGLLSIATQGMRLARPKEADVIVVEARRRAGRLIVTEAEVEGQRVTVVLDTGSDVSIGNLALRQLLARRRLLSEQGMVTLHAVTGQTIPATYMYVRRLDLTGVEMTNLGIAFADVHLFKQMNLRSRPALLLGMNALRAFDSVTIDLANRKLRFVLPTDAVRERAETSGAGADPAAGQRAGAG